MNQPIIRLKNIFKRYLVGEKEIHALSDISLEVREASIVGIIGRSGAGKSTLLRCINLLENPDSGEVLFRNKNLRSLSQNELQQVRHEIGMIFQHFNLLSCRNAFENVCLPLEIIGLPKDQIRKRALECLELVGLEDRATAFPSQLSGGQKQRVAIARALAANAKVLLSDEATSALDPETTAEILHLLRELNHRLKLTIVLITHEIAVVRDICDSVYVLDQGTVVEQGMTENIFAAPQHPVSCSFINAFVNSKIPEVIKEQLRQQPNPQLSDIVLRLTFTGETARKPIIAHLIREYATDINIISGYIDHIGKSTFGTLIVTIPNEPQVVKKCTDFVISQGVKVETLGFITTNG